MHSGRGGTRRAGAATAAATVTKPRLRPSLLDSNGARATLNPAHLAPQDIGQLQRSIGNRACVEYMTRQQPVTPVQRQEVGNQFYAHGGFMGAAKRMMSDPLWVRILETLMPDVYKDVTTRKVDVSYIPMIGTQVKVTDPKDPATLIPMLENNPVMAAYGMLQTQQLDQRQEGGRSDRIANMQALEWDVWLDPAVIQGYRVTINDQMELNQDKQLVDTMIIAHGNTKQTVIENKVGYPQYEAVKGTRKTGLGGARPAAWMDLFGRALQLATAPNADELMAKMKGEPRHTDEDDQSTYQTFKQPRTFTNVIDLYKKMFKKDTFSVLLDIKSHNASPDVLKKLIRELNRRGVHVYGVGVFELGGYHGRLNSLDQIRQEIGGKQMGAPKGIKWFHGIGNLQTACVDQKIFPGDIVAFNAGSMLDSVNWDADKPDADDAAIESIISQLKGFKERYGFHIGLYVQEGAADARAARKITQFSNKHRDVFDMGFGWGGLGNDMGSVSGGGSGMGAQEWIPWNEWDEDEVPGVPPGTGFDSTFEIKQFLETRKFTVKRGFVEVRTHAVWDPVPGTVNSYFMTLRKDEWGRDPTYTRYRCDVDKVGTARWDGLENGTYYIEIDVVDQDHATLKGTVSVTY